MKDDLKDKVVRWLTILAVLTILGGGGALLYPDYVRAQALKRQNAELQELIDRKKREINELKENQRRFRTDPDFVEMIARQNHRVFPGELVFTFEKD